MIASSGPQLLMVAGAVIASSSPSAVSWLYFAGRLIELPLGLVGVAMGTVLVPELSRAVHGDDRDAIVHAESRAMELAAGLALPATLGLLVLSEPIVRMLFEHGAFTAADTAATARALTWLSLGLPAHVLFKSLAPAFFARENTHHAAGLGAEGHLRSRPPRPSCSAICSGPRALRRPSRWAHGAARCRCCARAPRGSGFRSMQQRENACRVSCSRRWRWAPLLWLATRSMPLAGLHGLVQAAALLVLIAAGIAAYGLILRLFGVIGWREAVNAIRSEPPGGLRD